MTTSFALRRATSKDLAAMAEADGRAFGVHYTDSDLQEIESVLDPDRFWLAVDTDDAIVGVTGAFDLHVTVPGGAVLPMPGVTWVSVALTHRRRGVLRALLTEQHREFVEQGHALCGLTASEGAIYGRFGYGPTTANRSVEIDRRRAVLRADLPDTGGVRQAGTEEVRELAPELHRRWAAGVPGAVHRGPAQWTPQLADHEHRRGGATALFHLVHPDGYASYRRLHSERAAVVTEVVATTAQAHRELWRALLAMDLVETVRCRALALDDPLPLLLTDPRQVRTTGLHDGMWTRALDVPALLSARRYGIEIDAVLDVGDPFLDRGGRFRLRGGPDGATCEPTTAPADVRVDATALGPLVLGGQRTRPLAGAGLLTADDPALLHRIDLAFLTDRLPVHGTEF
ncbi:GNAT family N-acetyltransferase [Pseudonocardia humida]|uniref:GNAT family N-acetyltransferase n=1 Tax=Pseudonocardia humida TaxID=2800819 RepID=A0ABT0ZS44_9PSEU|nr:GNAT family N-acetyltransferase [Pseudonocardia humida]MCO1653535.1 GNAT family N-acetyltransferase [Pseudonocardia humida]